MKSTKILFYITFGISAALFIASWILPPPWQIHSSVLQAVGELTAIVSLYSFFNLIWNGKFKRAHAKVKGVEVGVENHQEDVDIPMEKKKPEEPLIKTHRRE